MNDLLKIGVVGSRSFNDYKLLKDTLDQWRDKVFLIVSGGALGADSLAERWAEENRVKRLIHRPEWDKYGKRAGFIRNQLIVNDSDMIISFWDGLSRGTEHTINIAKKEGKKVIIIYFNKVF
jgi:hypothetical protein